MQVINIYGVKEKIGCSHLAVLLTGFLNRMEYTAAYYGSDKAKAAEFGVPIEDVPEEDLAGCDLDFIVIDHGTDHTKASLRGATVVVSGDKPNEKQAEFDLKQLSAMKDAIIVKNFTNAGNGLAFPWWEGPGLPEEFDSFYGVLMTACLPYL